MLNFKLEERIKPNEEILALLQKTDYKVVNGAVLMIELHVHIMFIKLFQKVR